MKVTGLDLSLSGAGWATATGRVVHVGRFTSPAAGPTIHARSLRLRRLAGHVHEVAAGSDLVLIEQPAYSSGTGHTHDRSGLWWLVVARLTGAGVPVGEVIPQHLKMLATGKGNADKDAVLAAAVRLFPAVPVQSNDEADALWLAALAARYVGAPIDPWPVLPADRARAMTKIAWPELKGPAHA